MTPEPFYEAPPTPEKSLSTSEQIVSDGVVGNFKRMAAEHVTQGVTDTEGAKMRILENNRQFTERQYNMLRRAGQLSPEQMEELTLRANNILRRLAAEDKWPACRLEATTGKDNLVHVTLVRDTAAVPPPAETKKDPPADKPSPRRPRGGGKSDEAGDVPPDGSHEDEPGVVRSSVNGFIRKAKELGAKAADILDLARLSPESEEAYAERDGLLRGFIFSGPRGEMLISKDKTVTLQCASKTIVLRSGETGDAIQTDTFGLITLERLSRSGPVPYRDLDTLILTLEKQDVPRIITATTQLWNPDVLIGIEPDTSVRNRGRSVEQLINERKPDEKIAAEEIVTALPAWQKESLKDNGQKKADVEKTATALIESTNVIDAPELDEKARIQYRLHMRGFMEAVLSGGRYTADGKSGQYRMQIDANGNAKLEDTINPLKEHLHKELTKRLNEAGVGLYPRYGLAFLQSAEERHAKLKWQELLAELEGVEKLQESSPRNAEIKLREIDKEMQMADVYFKLVEKKRDWLSGLKVADKYALKGAQKDIEDNKWYPRWWYNFKIDEDKRTMYSKRIEEIEKAHEKMNDITYGTVAEMKAQLGDIHDPRLDTTEVNATFSADRESFAKFDMVLAAIEQGLKSLDDTALKAAKSAGKAIAGPMGEILAGLTYQICNQSTRALMGDNVNIPEQLAIAAGGIVGALGAGALETYGRNMIARVIKFVPKEYRSQLVPLLKKGLDKLGEKEREVAQKAIDELFEVFMSE